MAAVIAGLRIVLDVQLASDWPGDEMVDLWLLTVPRQLRELSAVEDAQVIEWERREFAE